MSKIFAFTTCILEDTLINPILNNEIFKCLKEEEDKSNGNFKSNEGGFQTKPILNKLINSCILNKSAELIMNNYTSNNKIYFNLTNLWINKNKKGDFNVLHRHGKSHFSGCFYLKVPEKKGEIIFRLEKYFELYEDLIIDEHNEFNDFFKITPKNNMFLIFPSNLYHMVNPHNEDMERISVSFNIDLKKNLI